MRFVKIAQRFASAFAALFICACGGAAVQSPPAAAPETQQAAPLAWSRFAPEGEGFSIDMPGQVERVEREAAGERVPYYVVTNARHTFLVNSHEYSATTVSSTARDTLFLWTVQGATASSECTVVSMTRAQVDGYDACDVSVRCTRVNMRLRVLLQSNRVLLAVAETDVPEIAQRFLDSLHATSLPVAPVPASWQTITSDADHVRFEMPTGVSSGQGDFNVSAWRIESPRGQFALAVMRVQLLPGTRESPRSVRSTCNDLFEESSQSENTSVTPIIDVDGWPAFDQVEQMQNGFVTVARTICINDAVYLLSAKVPDSQRDSQLVTRFYQSFHAEPPVAPRNARRGANGRRR